MQVLQSKHFYRRGKQSNPTHRSSSSRHCMVTILSSLLSTICNYLRDNHTWQSYVTIIRDNHRYNLQSLQDYKVKDFWDFHILSLSFKSNRWVFHQVVERSIGEKPAGQLRGAEAWEGGGWGEQGSHHWGTAGLLNTISPMMWYVICCLLNLFNQNAISHHPENHPSHPFTSPCVMTLLLK